MPNSSVRFCGRPEKAHGLASGKFGSLIQLQFTSARNWPFGSALATVVTAAVLIALLVSVRRSLARVMGA